MFEEIPLENDEKLDKLIPEGPTRPLLHSDGFCKPSLKHPYTYAQFPEGKSLVFLTSDFIGRMSKQNNCFWLETNDFFDTIRKNTQKINNGIKSTKLF